jgi:hypothetical protein
MTDPEVKFRWRSGFRLISDPQACGERLKELKKELGRDPQPEDLVEDAKSEASPFRDDIFRKSDSEAALQHRLEVARSMLRACVIIEIKTTGEGGEAKIDVSETHYIQHVPDHGYMTTEEVVNDDELRRLALIEIISGLRAWKLKLSRFRSLSDKFENVIVEAEEMLSEIERNKK